MVGAVTMALIVLGLVAGCFFSLFINGHEPTGGLPPVVDPGRQPHAGADSPEAGGARARRVDPDRP